MRCAKALHSDEQSDDCIQRLDQSRDAREKCKIREMFKGVGIQESSILDILSSAIYTIEITITLILPTKVVQL